MIKATEWYLFLLAALLIAAVYYVGVRTDVGALTNLATSVGNTYTGRNNQGQFQGVPSAGAPFTT